jgi:adenosylmethionine-8-amino-7-oxononanoate aminotransferase
MNDEPDWLADGLAHVWQPYVQMKTAPRPPAVSATRGTRIILADGRELVDGIASWWTAVHGYNHPLLLDAAARQLECMPHVMMAGLAHEQPYRLASRLAALAPGDLDHVFYSESGSVAVEVAMKMAVQFWRNSTGEQRTKFVGFSGGYHGDTFATMSVCDPEGGMHKAFAGALPAQYFAELPETGELGEKLGRLLAAHDDIAAVIVEPLIQGAAGIRMHDVETLRRIASACHANGTLLIFDEIFTGFGRTGAMFAADKAGVVPDIMTVGKALTGGVAPLAATIASRRIFDAFYDDDFGKALIHGPTYTGHALGCAVANASLDLFETEPRLEQVAAIENFLQTALQPLRKKPSVADVRISGAVGAVELDHDFDVGEARARFIERGVFLRPIGRTIYLAPPYVTGESDLSLLVRAIAEEIEFQEAQIAK